MADLYGWFVGGNPKIEGETLDEEAKKTKAFDIEDFTFGVENPVNVGSASGGLGSGRVVMERLEINKRTDSATANMVLASCTGAHIDEFHISMRKGGADAKSSGGEFVHITMKNVVIESVKWSGADGDETLKEALVLASAGIKIEYMKQDMKGKLSKGGAVEWNQTTNKPKM